MSFNPINIEVRFRSDFVPIVALKPEVQKKVDDLFLTPLAEAFFQKLNISYHSVEYIGFDNSISEIEFFKTEAELVKNFFYEYVFAEVKKNLKKKVANKVKFCFTIDSTLTPFYLDGLKYGVITLGVKPILYYIYIDLQKLIHFIKTSNVQPV